MKVLSDIILFIWQLPQMLVAVLYYMYVLLFKNEYYMSWRGKNAIHYCNIKGGITLGNQVFVDYLAYNYKKLVEHELGHTKQSLVLGPLYLIIIGIPSFIWATLRTIFPYFRKFNYYSFYTERWANKLQHIEE